MIRSTEGQIDAPIYPNCAMPMRLSRVILSRDNLDEKGRRQSEFESGGR
jgi:hypothetical protein